MRVNLAQIAPYLSKEKNLVLHKDTIKAREDHCDLLIFPELSLNGYLLKDAIFEDAYSVDELSELVNASCDVVFGCALKEGSKIYNAFVYGSKGDIKFIYKKSHLPNYGLFQEARFFFSGDGAKVYETRFGRVCPVVCEDLFNASFIADIVALNPDLIVVISNSPARGFEDELGIENAWNSLLSSTALLSGANVVFVNRVGFEDGLGFWGGSRVVKPNGQVQNKAKLFEKEMVEAEINFKLSQTQKYLLRY